MCKRVLMFGWEYPPKNCGGLGVACQGIVRGLLHHGAHVTLVLPQADAETEAGMNVLSPTEEHIRTIRVRSAIQPYDSPAVYADRMEALRDVHGKDLELYGEDLGGAVHAYTELSVELTKHVQPEVIHSHDWMTFEAGARAARYHRQPLVTHVHATELDRTHFSPNQWIYGKERDGLIKADRIIAVSNYTKNILVQHYGIHTDKIDVVHNGAQDTHNPYAITNIKNDRPMVLFVGRLTVQKGAFHFLEAARIVREHKPEAQFVMAGDGYLLAELIDRACQMGLQENVLFAGKVNQHEVRELYRNASCFVMPSTSEPFGLVALEAVAQGTPVILSRQSGVCEVLPHSLIVDFWDTDKLADCIITVLREQPLAMQLRSEAPHAIHQLRWENQAQKIMMVYDKARSNL